MVVGSAMAHAAGFAIAEQGTESLGVAGAATARRDLAETGFYNPAATPPGVRATAGVSLIFPSITHFDPESRNVTKAESHTATPPYVHGGWVGRFEQHKFGILLSGNVPFGASLSWPETWNGRFEVRAIELQVFEGAFHTVYGVQLNEDIEVGAAGSLRALRSTVSLERNIDAVNVEPRVRLGGATNAVGGGASVWARFGEVQGGVSYRSSAALDFAGNAHFEDVPPELSRPAHDQAVTTAVQLPERVAVGAAWDPGWGAVSVDLEYMHWARFETFEIDFADDETPDVDEPRDWHDTVAVRVGYEHRFLSRALTARAGFAFDPTPSPTETLSPTLPDASRVVGTVGVGYRFRFGLGASLSFANIALLKTTSTGEEAYPGTYTGGARVLAFGLSYKSQKNGGSLPSRQSDVE